MTKKMSRDKKRTKKTSKILSSSTVSSSTKLTEKEGEGQDQDDLEKSVIKSNINVRQESRDSDRARLELLLAVSNAREQSVWETVCREIDAEFLEIDLILTKLGLRPFSYRKDKNFPVYDLEKFTYADEPNMETCVSRIYLEHFIFPHILPAIKSMILYVRKNRVLQCRAGLFNPLDYIVEYLYTNNSFHPQRRDNQIPLDQIPFAMKWLTKYPRAPYPKWLTMSEEAAALIIQNALRKSLAGKKQKELKSGSDHHEDQNLFRKKMLCSPPVPEICPENGTSTPTITKLPPPIFPPYYTEVTGESDEQELKTHSDDCFLCNQFRQFLLQRDVPVLAVTAVA